MSLRTKYSTLAAGAAAAVMTVASGAAAKTTADMGPSALTGTVSSAREGNMEGVLVSAKKDGSNMTITVVTDEKGHYAFPSSRLSPGHYALKIRAVGYDLDGPADTSVTAGKNTAVDIKLKDTADLEDQLTSAEWLASIPGTDDQKRFLDGCVGCHTLKRPLTSKFDAHGFEGIIRLMGTFAPGSVPERPQMLHVGENRGHRGDDVITRAAAYLSSINLSQGPRKYALKTLPRPTGNATHVIVTTYDLPRKEAMPHDVLSWPGSPGGHIWYSDFGSQYIGELDPETGKVTDYLLPTPKPDEPKGNLDLEADPDNNLWVAMMYQLGIAKLDTKTKKFTVYPLPEGGEAKPHTHGGMVAPQHWNVDGKVWTKNSDNRVTYRLDVKSGQWENMGLLKDQNDYQVRYYGDAPDKENNLYLFDFGGTKIGKVDAKTGKVMSWSSAFAHSRPRRGHFDETRDEVWFGEYGANGVGTFDPKTKQIHEWRLPIEWSLPYDAMRNKKGDVWAGSMLTDRATRLNPTTGEFTDYLLPESTNIRRVTYDDARDSFWVGGVLTGKIVRVEPLD